MEPILASKPYKTASFKINVLNPKGATDEETLSYVKEIFKEAVDEFHGDGFTNGICPSFVGRYKDREVTLVVEIDIDLIVCNHGKEFLNVRKLKMTAIVEIRPWDDLGNTLLHFTHRLKGGLKEGVSKPLGEPPEKLSFWRRLFRKKKA